MEPTPTNKTFWQGEKIRLRAVREEDAALWLAEDTDTEGIRNMNYGVVLPKTAADAKQFAKRYANFNNSAERIMFSIETLSSKLVGGINIHSMDKVNGTFGTGLRIYRAFRGQGYAAEAKRIVLRYAFHELRFQKYNVSCIETNAAEIKHLRRVGCQEEGRRRRSIYTNGRFYDELLFGMTKEEFEANNNQA